MLQTFAKALSLEGYDVRVAASPLVGLQEVVERRPTRSSSICGCRSSTASDSCTACASRVAHRHTPVAIITGDSCIDDPALSELHGLEAEVCFKPMWIDEVVALTRSLLAKRRSADQIS